MERNVTMCISNVKIKLQTSDTSLSASKSLLQTTPHTSSILTSTRPKEEEPELSLTSKKYGDHNKIW